MLHRDRYSSTPYPLDANSAPQWNPMAVVQHELDVGFSVRISCACVCVRASKGWITLGNPGVCWFGKSVGL